MDARSTFQKNEWFQWPPPLLRTTVASSLGILSVPTALFRSTMIGVIVWREGVGGGETASQLRGCSTVVWTERGETGKGGD